jgi:hypothetical protein
MKTNIIVSVILNISKNESINGIGDIKISKSMKYLTAKTTIR